MSGIEVVGLISAVVGILTAITDVYDGLKDAANLPEAIRKVAERLPLVRSILESVEKHIASHPDEQACQAMETVVKKCKINAERLQEIFNAVAPSEPPSKRDRYRAIVRGWGKGQMVEVLAKEMLDDVRLLAEKHAVGAASETQIEQLQKAIEEISKLSPSLPNEGSVTQSHSGSGDNITGNKYGGNHNSPPPMLD
ncbi:unnamed protein product [Penicillium manginii]